MSNHPPTDSDTAEQNEQEQMPARDVSPSRALDASPQQRGRVIAKSLVEQASGAPGERAQTALREAQAAHQQADQDVKQAERNRAIFAHAQAALRQVCEERGAVSETAADVDALLAEADERLTDDEDVGEEA